MDISMSSVIISLAVVAAATCMWKVLYWSWLRPKQLERWLRDQGFRGPPYRFLYGDTKKAMAMLREARSKPMDAASDDILPYLRAYHHHSSKLYGKNYCIWLGPTPRLVISDPKLIKEVLNNYESFQKVQGGPIVKIFLTGLAAYEGKKWAMHRKLLNPAFSLDMLKHMVSAMNSSCNELLSKWEALLSPEGSCEVDVWHYFEQLTADVISRTAFGSNYQEGKKLFNLQKEQLHLALGCLRSSYLPGSRLLPTKTNKRLKSIADEIGALIGGIIQNKEKVMKVGEGTNDLLGILLKTISEEAHERGNKTNVKMTMEEVIEECKLFYTAGQETTSSLLLWTMVCLGRHQEWQTRAREEVFAVFGNNEPDFEGLRQLKTVTMILYEVLRLYPSAPVTARRTHEKVKLGDAVLPPGVELELSFIATHHDPDIWGEDAKEFKPERFSEGTTKAARVQGAFLAFAGGPRICIGQNFAMMEAKIALMVILRHFSFKLSPSYKHAPAYIFNIVPQYGAQLILQKI